MTMAQDAAISRRSMRGTLLRPPNSDSSEWIKRPSVAVVRKDAPGRSDPAGGMGHRGNGRSGPAAQLSDELPG
jgi:hypothetical protein